MSDVPEDLRYTQQHEWARHDEDRVVVGITDYAQEQLGDVVYLEFPGVGATVTKGESMGEIESTKSVADLYAPVSGTVAEVNGDCRDNPAIVNQDPYGEGWMIVIEPSDPEEVDSLLSSDEYEELLVTLGGEESSA